MDQLNLRSRSGDMTLTLVERKGRITVNLEVDKPLDWGFEEAGLVLEPVDVARLKHWAATGKALPARGPGAPTGEERDEGPVEALARLTWDAQAADGPFGWGDLTEDQRQRWRAAARKTLTGESATAIQAVRELHRPVTAWVDTVIHDGAEEPERRAVYADDGSLVVALDDTESTCGGCRPGTPYPCATVQLLNRLI